MAGDPIRAEQFTESLKARAEREAEEAERSEKAVQEAEKSARDIKAAQDRKKRALSKIQGVAAEVLKGATTESGGPPMVTLERVNSVLGSMGMANAVAQGVKEAQKIQAANFKQGKNGAGDAFTVTVEGMKKFLEAYSQDVIRGYAQGITGRRMSTPGGRIEGVDVMRRLGLTGTGGRIAGAGMEMLLDPTTFGLGPVAKSFSLAGRGIGKAIALGQHYNPYVNRGVEAVARVFNKFRDIDRLPNGRAIREAFQQSLDPSGEVNIAALSQNMRQFAVRGGGQGVGLPSLQGLRFDKPLADLIQNEWMANFVNGTRTTWRDKTLGFVKDATDVLKTSVTRIDPIFHARNLMDGIYKNSLEKVGMQDYLKSINLILDKSGAGMSLKNDLAVRGVLGQIGMTGGKDKGLLSGFTQFMNDVVRLPLALREMRAGGTLESAGRLVNQTHIDYRAAMNSPLVNALGNRWVPFAKYEVGNPLSYLFGMPRYSARMSQYEKLQRNTEEEKDPWKIPPQERGKMRIGGWTGLGTSFEDLLGRFDMSFQKSIAGPINSWVKLIGEKVTGFSSFRDRDIKEYESGKKYERLPPFVRDALGFTYKNGRPMVLGSRDQLVQGLAGRGVTMGGRWAGIGEGEGSVFSALTGLHPVGEQAPWMINKERQSLNQRLRAWFPWGGTAEAQAAAAPGTAPKNPRQAAIEAWAKAQGDPTLVGTKSFLGFLDTPGPSPGELTSRYWGDPFAWGGNISPDEKDRQQRIQAFLRMRRDLGNIVSEGMPLGRQTRYRNAVNIKQFEELAKFMGFPPDMVSQAKAAQERSMQPMRFSLEAASAMQPIQGGQPEGAVIRRMLELVKSYRSFLSEESLAAVPEGPGRIEAEGVKKLFGQKMALRTMGIYLTDEEADEAERIVKEATDVKKLQWYQEMQRAILQGEDALADAQIDPVLAARMKAENAVKKWLASKEAIQMIENGMEDEVNKVAEAKAAAGARDVEKKRIGIVRENAAQIEAFVKEKTVAAAALLKQNFESGTIGLAAYFASQRENINARADQGVAAQTSVLQSLRPSGMMENSTADFVQSMIDLAESGKFDELQKNRDELALAGVDVEAFFRAALEIAKLITERTKALAQNREAETNANQEFMSAMALIEGKTAGTLLQAGRMQLGGLPYDVERTEWVKQFDAQTRSQRIAQEKALNYTPGLAFEDTSDDNADYQDYLAKKQALDDADVAREKLRTASLEKMDRDYWQARAKNAQVGTDLLLQLTTNLYEFSGKKSKEAFFMMKAAAVASALVKGYQAAVNAYEAGTSIGGPYAPYIGMTFAALATAATGSQIALITQQQMASGGLVKGGSGYKDDVDIKAMKDEFVMPQDSVRHYGVDFMEAVRTKMLDIRGFDVPDMPEHRVTTGRYAEGGLVSDMPEQKIVLENNTGTPMKMTDGGSKFDGKQMVRTIIFDLADTDPQFVGLMKSMGGRY